MILGVVRDADVVDHEGHTVREVHPPRSRWRPTGLAGTVARTSQSTRHVVAQPVHHDLPQIVDLQVSAQLRTARRPPPRWCLASTRWTPDQHCQRERCLVGGVMVGAHVAHCVHTPALPVGLTANVASPSPGVGVGWGWGCVGGLADAAVDGATGCVLPRSDPRDVRSTNDRVHKARRVASASPTWCHGNFAIEVRAANGPSNVDSALAFVANSTTLSSSSTIVATTGPVSRRSFVSLILGRYAATSRSGRRAGSPATPLDCHGRRTHR